MITREEILRSTLNRDEKEQVSLIFRLMAERDAYREVAISRYDPNHTSCSESDECRCSPLDAERSIDAEAQRLMETV